MLFPAVTYPPARRPPLPKKSAYVAASPSRSGVFARQPSAESFDDVEKLLRRPVGARGIEGEPSLIADHLGNERARNRRS